MKGAIELGPHPVHARDLEVGAAAHHMQLLVSKEASSSSNDKKNWDLFVTRSIHV